ncbi:MAG TPA: phage integrase family protein [Novosphingobium sp.]|mgnify:CR=1 FL=1|nr:phage integrase family protein [Novosphingobium sp.]
MSAIPANSELGESPAAAAAPAAAPAGDVWLGEPVDPPRPRRGGRKPGSTIATFANLRTLTVQDFAFVRGIVSGLAPEVSFARFYANRYFDAEGKVAVHGHTVAARAEQLTQRIAVAAQQVEDEEIRAAGRRFAAAGDGVDVAEAVRAQAHLAFEDWAAQLPDGMYGENELAERYQDYLAEQGTPQAASHAVVIDQAASVSRRVAALNHLQTVLAVPPRPEQPVAMWFAPALARRFVDLKLATMGELVRWIAARGPRWHADVKGLGPYRAARVLGWLREAEASLGRIDGPAWDRPGEVVLPAGTLPSQPHSPALRRRSSSDLVPLQLLQVPERLNGENGLFRNSKGGAWNVGCDLEAIQLWLGMYQAAGRVRTHEAYQRELERFYLWCIVERGKALSSIDTNDALAYQAFLGAIPLTWITWRRVARTHRLWRPFRKQLDFRSQHYAIGVVREFYDACRNGGYLTVNPFADVKAHAKAGRAKRLDATRSLSDEDLQLVGQRLAALPGLKSKVPLRGALARRTQLIVHLALTTGLRLAEIVGSSTADVRREMVDGEPAWILAVEGKGSKPRETTLQDDIYDMVVQHQKEWRDLVGKANPQRLLAFDKRPPLVAALHARAGDGKGSSVVGDVTELAHENSALSRVGLYRTLKTFFKQLGKLHPAQKAHFEAMSTHWLRHTFAHHVLRTSPGDQGLKLAQQLLGHQDISTTAEYLKQANHELVRAGRRVNPLAPVLPAPSS